MDNLPSGGLKVAPYLIQGAEQFLPYYDERPFLPSLANIVIAAQKLMQVT
jgi:hypothetical protein